MCCLCNFWTQVYMLFRFSTLLIKFDSKSKFFDMIPTYQLGLDHLWNLVYQTCTRNNFLLRTYAFSNQFIYAT